VAVSKTAQKNHDVLFPNHVSSLNVTDPELIEVFHNFAFDEVLAHNRLGTRTTLMVQLAALIAAGALAEYRVMLGAALTVGVTPVEAKEVVYHAVPYVGMGRVFDFVNTTNEVLTDHGVQLPLPRQSTTTPEDRAERGRAVQEEIVGTERVEAMYNNASEDELRFYQLLSANAFGDYWTRDGIDIPTRELLTLAMLVSLGGADPQARGHVSANIRVGNTRQQLLDVVTVLVPYIGYPRSINALAAINDVTKS
jgi:4-carboxymuconolactone decarboxylase